MELSVVEKPTNLRGYSNQQIGQGVVSNIPAAQNRNVPAVAPLQTTRGDVSPVSAVASAPTQAALARLGNAITFTATNGGGATANYKMFDAWGLLSDVGNVSATAMTYVSNGRTTAFNSESAVRPYYFSGFSVQSTVSAASLAASLTMYQLSSSGSLQASPLVLSAAYRNTQQLANLLTFEFDEPFVGGPDVALVFPIPAGETITFTWFVMGQLNKVF